MTVKLKGLNDAQKPETAIVDNDVSEIDPAESLKAIATKNRDNDTSEVQSPSPTVFKQCIDNLPDDIKSLRRFVRTGYKGDIKAAIGQWQNPQNWRRWFDCGEDDEDDVPVTFVACVDDTSFDESIADNFVFYDFDHVLDADTGEFKSVVAKSLFNFLHVEGTYCELSQSRTGLHLFSCPTKGKFPPCKHGKIHFDDGDDMKLEIFYRTNRCCLVTGNLYQCHPCAPIVFNELADQQFQHILELARRDKEQRDAKKNPQNQSDKANNRRSDLPPEIKKLIAEINGKVTPAPLEAKGYLKKSANGNYCCPWCDSGHGDNQSGAMFFYNEGDTSHFTCFSEKVIERPHGGDIVDFLAQVWYGDKHGQKFFATIKRAADEFGVKYDPKIFELSTRPLTVEDHMTGDEVVDAWQKECGKYISPELYAEICAAREFLMSLTPETLTAAVARSQPTLKKVALCTYFDFASTAADTFWATLEGAKNLADAQVTESKSGFTATADVDVRALATLDVKQLRKRVDGYAKEYEKAHKKYQENFQRDKIRAEHDKRVVARNKDAKAAIGDAYKLKDPAHANYLLLQENDDTGRAEQFAYLFGKSIRFIPKSERWLVFKRDSEFKSCGVWQLGNPGKNTIVMPYAAEMHKFLVANMSDNPDEDEKKAVEEWRNLKRMNNAVRLAGAGNHNNIQISADDLDTHPELLNCRNGVINLQTGEFFDRVDPTLLITQKCNAVWRGQDFRNADVDKFFTDVFTDVSTREALIRFLGYGITGDISAHVAHFWKGRGRNGKTTLLNLLFALLGGYAVKLATAAILDTGRPTDANNATTGLNPIRGARLAVFNELKPQDRLNAPLFKDLVGGDKINIRQLNCEYEEIKPTAKIIVCGNFHPKLDNNGDDDGLPSRIRAVPFTEQFTGDRCDPRLLDKLTTPEALSGLLALLVNAAQDFYRDGLLESSAMSTAKRKYLAENNFVAQFVEDNCVLGDKLSIPQQQFLARLKSEYRADCDRYTDRALRNIVVQIQGIQSKRIGKGNVCSFVGVGWAGEQSDDYGEPIQSSEDFLVPPPR